METTQIEKPKYQIEDIIALFNENHKLELSLGDYNLDLSYRPMISKIKRKYVYLDIDSCGKYLVDVDLNVWSIAAYGQKNHFLGDINSFMAKLQEDNKTLKNQLELKKQGIRSNYSLWEWY